MGVLIVGDVHGCYYTLKALVQGHWDPEQDLLILVGDLLNKGPHSVKTWRYWLKLSAKYPTKVILLRGNHEQWFLDQSRRKLSSKQFRKLEKSFLNKGLSTLSLQDQIGNLPLHWENEQLFVSHAGLAAEATDPYDLRKPNNLLTNRKKLASLAKIQVCGHQILEGDKPLFKAKENAWLIDTGAWCNSRLSALYFEEGQESPKVIQVERKPKDNRGI